MLQKCLCIFFKLDLYMLKMTIYQTFCFALLTILISIFWKKINFNNFFQTLSIYFRIFIGTIYVRFFGTILRTIYSNFGIVLEKFLNQYYQEHINVFCERDTVFRKNLYLYTTPFFKFINSIGNFISKPKTSFKIHTNIIWNS